MPPPCQTEQLCAHRVSWRRFFMVTIIMLFYVLPLFATPTQNLDSADFNADALQRAPRLPIIFSLFLAFFPIYLIIYAVFRCFHTNTSSTAIPKTFILDSFNTGIFPTFVQVNITSRVLALFSTCTLYVIILFRTTEKVIRESPDENIDFLRVLLETFKITDFYNLYATMETSIWPVLFHAPVKELVKWLLVRKMYKRALLRSNNSNQVTELTEEIVMCTAVACAGGFSAIPALEKATEWISVKTSVGSFGRWMEVAGAVMVACVLEIGSTVYVALTVAVQIASEGKLAPKVWKALIVAALLHFNWPSPPLLSYGGERSDGSDVPALPDVVQWPSIVAAVVVVVFCIRRLRLLNRVKAEKKVQ